MAKGLTREGLAKTALDIVDREGLDALSMRRLGAELSVDPKAAYRHLPNKESLLDGVVEAVISEIDLEVDSTLPWGDQLRQLAWSTLRTLLAHPNAAPLLAQRPLSTAGSLGLVEKAYEIMTGAGVPLYDAGLTINCLGILAPGIAVAWGGQAGDAGEADAGRAFIEELPRGRFPRIVSAFESGAMSTGFGDVFDYAITSLVARLEGVRAQDGDTRGL